MPRIPRMYLDTGYFFKGLRKNEKLLHRLFEILKRNYKISLREIAINLKLNREKVRKIFNKK